jgi:hypothetical protein
VKPSEWIEARALELSHKEGGYLDWGRPADSYTQRALMEYLDSVHTGDVALVASAYFRGNWQEPCLNCGDAFAAHGEVPFPCKTQGDFWDPLKVVEADGSERFTPTYEEWLASRGGNTP